MNHAQPSLTPSLARRLAATCIDVPAFVVVPILWWHWSEWAQYTSTFGRRWPAGVALPVMTLIPLTCVWLEAVLGRGPGQLLLGLHVASADGGPTALGRRLMRAAIKWSPTWIGPAVRIVDLAAGTSTGEDFSADHLLPAVAAVADRLPPSAGQLFWTAEASARAMNYGSVALAALAIGTLLALLPSRRSLLDRLTGTKLIRFRSRRTEKV